MAPRKFNILWTLKSDQLLKVLKKTGVKTTKLNTKAKRVARLKKLGELVLPRNSGIRSSYPGAYTARRAKTLRNGKKTVKAWSPKCRKSVGITRPKYRLIKTKSGAYSTVGCQKTKRCGKVCRFFGSYPKPSTYTSWL